jgi:hypothetical protein
MKKTCLHWTSQNLGAGSVGPLRVTISKNNINYVINGFDRSTNLFIVLMFLAGEPVMATSLWYELYGRR